jgi:hypothetical protein
MEPEDLLPHSQVPATKPYVPSTTFGSPTLGANRVVNKLFIAFLFSDPDVGVQLLKDVGLIKSCMV